MSDLCALGGGSYFGLGLGWALLVLVSALPVVACVGVFSRLPLCGVGGLRWGLTLLGCACTFDDFLL